MRLHPSPAIAPQPAPPDCLHFLSAAAQRLPTVELSLRDGTTVALRPQRPDDRELVAAFFNGLSDRSRFLRFLSPIHQLSPPLLDRLCAVDGEGHFAWMAMQEGCVAGLARWVRTRPPAVAEIALTVRDDLQGRGLGRLLLQALALVAPTRGVTCFEIVALSENRPVLTLLRSVDARFSFRHGHVAGMLSAATIDRGQLPSEALLELAGPGTAVAAQAAAS